MTILTMFAGHFHRGTDLIGLNKFKCSKEPLFGWLLNAAETWIRTDSMQEVYSQAFVVERSTSVTAIKSDK